MRACLQSGAEESMIAHLLRKKIVVTANVENLNSLSQTSLSEAFHLLPQNLLVDS